MLIIILLLIQLSALTYVLLSSSMRSNVIAAVLYLISLMTAVYVVARQEHGDYKLIWVFMILLFPIFGGVLYVFFSFQMSTKKLRNKIDLTCKKKLDYLKSYTAESENVIRLLPEYSRQIRYLCDHAGFSIHSDNVVEYIPSGEEKHARLLSELEKAEKYIFLEYFIIQEGKMWNSVLEVLKKKAAEGVTVRVLYDDLGCFMLLPKDYGRQLKKYGIESAIFNPFRPFLSTVQNNRDHRKIVSIDGKVAFTGGINIADEYINAVEKHGHWKDCAVMVKGSAAHSFTLMFLEMWEIASGSNEDYSIFCKQDTYKNKYCRNGFVIPYSDSPMDKENVGEQVYQRILSDAKDYVYICTPYLIIDDSMMKSLCLAAKSGVDVRIITPYKGDKWFVHLTTRSYYRELIRAGVKIYEYEKGFIHSKTFVSDDRIATVGTTNLDFRSLYLHFECGMWMCDCPSVLDVKKDFEDTLKVCRKITEKNCESNFFVRIIQDFLRVFAPLM